MLETNFLVDLVGLISFHYCVDIFRYRLKAPYTKLTCFKYDKKFIFCNYIQDKHELTCRKIITTRVVNASNSNCCSDMEDDANLISTLNFI